MALADIIEPFTWGSGGRKLTPEEIAREKEIAEALMAGGVDTSPVGHWLQGLARVAQAGAGAFRDYRAGKAERANADWNSGLIGDLSKSLMGSASPAASITGDGSVATTPAGPLKGAIGTPDGPKLAEVESYIRQAAERRGIDPNVAVRVARSEGLANGVWQSNVHRNGKRETSYGPFQLLVGGGLGDKFTKLYGKSPADPSTLYQQIDFALDEAATGGWSPWYGAAKVGVGRRTGLDKARALGYQPTARTDERTTGAPPVQVASLDPAAGMSALQPPAFDLPSAGPIPTQRPEMTAAPDIQQQIAQSLLASDPMAQTAPMQAPALPTGPTTQAPSMSMPGASPMPMMQPGQYNMGMVPPADASQMVPPVSSVPASLNGLPDAAPVPTPRDMVAELTQSMAAQPQASAPASVQQQIAQAVAPKFSMDPRVIEAMTDPRASAQTRQFGNMVLQHQMGLYQSEQERYLKQQQQAAELAQRQALAQQMGIDPSYAMDKEVWDAAVTKQFRDPQRTTIDGRLVDSGSGEVVADFGQRPTSGMQEYDAYANYERQNGRTPLGPLEYEQALRKSGAANQTVTIGGEKKYDEKMGEGYAATMSGIQEEGRRAPIALGTLNLMQQQIADPKFYSGAGGESVLQLKRWARALGMDAEGVDSAEAFNAMSKAAALDTMGGSLGTGFSNADRDFVIDQVPNLGNTPEGNSRLIEIQKKLNERKIEIARMARDYAKANDGRLDMGFDDQLAIWAEANPLFEQEPSGPRSIGSEAEFNALPSGAEFIAPDGSIRRKP